MDYRGRTSSSLRRRSSAGHVGGALLFLRLWDGGSGVRVLSAKAWLIVRVESPVIRSAILLGRVFVARAELLVVRGHDG